MKKSKIILSSALVLSLAFNVFTVQKIRKDNQIWNLSFQNANSWDNYLSIHHVKEAHEKSKGKGIKVGILDHYFGIKDHKGLYAGEKDFLSRQSDHESISEHGYWLTNTLKEIAPECEVYALSTLESDDEQKKVQAMVEAIDWAIENKLDILTYSEAIIENEDNKVLLDQAVEKAEQSGVIITFIHYEHPNNLEPIGMYFEDEVLQGQPFVTIYSYDYNLLLKEHFNKFGMGKTGTEETLDLFFSNSSSSVVTAGMLAILKSINPNLTPAEYREILVQSAHEGVITEPQTLKEIHIKHLADIDAAIQYMNEKYN